MRIISGTARGTKLYSLEGLITRPTLDRVKESLFNIIQNEVYDCDFLDLFSGSGAIGLEAASRGAKNVVLCEKNKKAISIIKKNIEKTHLENVVKLYNNSFENVLNKYEGKFDIIYIDPPYKTDYIYKSAKLIKENQLLKEDGIIIAETDEEERILEDLKKLKANIINQKRYGRVHLVFFTFM